LVSPEADKVLGPEPSLPHRSATPYCTAYSTGDDSIRSSTLWNVLSWNVHWQCGSDHVPDCRAAATAILLKMAHEREANVIVSVELEASEG